MCNVIDFGQLWDVDEYTGCILVRCDGRLELRGRYYRWVGVDEGI